MSRAADLAARQREMKQRLTQPRRRIGTSFRRPRQGMTNPDVIYSVIEMKMSGYSDAQIYRGFFTPSGKFNLIGARRNIGQWVKRFTIDGEWNDFAWRTYLLEWQFREGRRQWKELKRISGVFKERESNVRKNEMQSV